MKEQIHPITIKQNPLTNIKEIIVKDKKVKPSQIAKARMNNLTQRDHIVLSAAARYNAYRDSLSDFELFCLDKYLKRMKNTNILYQARKRLGRAK